MKAKGSQREPKGAQRGTKGTKKATKASPKEPQRSHVWPQGAQKTKNMKKGRFEATHFGSRNGPKSIKKRCSKKHSKNITISISFKSILVHKKDAKNSENTVQITSRELTEIQGKHVAPRRKKMHAGTCKNKQNHWKTQYQEKITIFMKT